MEALSNLSFSACFVRGDHFIKLGNLVTDEDLRNRGLFLDI